MLAGDMVLISLLTRMRFIAMGKLAASVPFSYRNKQMELLVGEEARVARRHVAAHTSPEALSAMRNKALPKSSQNWELLQENERAGVELALLREERGALDSAYAEVRSRKTALLTVRWRTAATRSSRI